MLYFEFGQDGLAEAHALRAFELSVSAIKGAFVLFSTTLAGPVGFVCKITLFWAARAAGRKSHASRYPTSTLSTGSS